MRCRHLLTLDSTYPGGHPQGCIGVTGVVLTSVEPFCFMHTILLSFALQLLAYQCSANAFNRIVNHLKYKSCMLLLEITERSTLYIYTCGWPLISASLCWGIEGFTLCPSYKRYHACSISPSIDISTLYMMYSVIFSKW